MCSSVSKRCNYFPINPIRFMCDEMSYKCQVESSKSKWTLIFHFEIDAKWTLINEIAHFLFLKQTRPTSYQIAQWVCDLKWSWLHMRSSISKRFVNSIRFIDFYCDEMSYKCHINWIKSSKLKWTFFFLHRNRRQMDNY